MINLLKFLLFSLLATIVLAASQAEDPSTAEDRSRFQELLANVDEKSVHAALHTLSDRLRDGIFHKDATALEAIHSEDAPLATFLLKMVKRQAGESANSSVADSTSSSTSTSPVTTSTTDISTTDTSPTTSTAPPTSTSSPSSTVTTTSTSSPPPVTTSISSAPSTSPPSTTPTSSASSSSATPTTSSTSSSSSTSTSSTSTSSPTSSYTSTSRLTTTLPNGGVSTLTSVFVVAASPTGSTAGSTSTPGLQTAAAASPTRGLKMEMLAMLGGAFAVAMAL